MAASDPPDSEARGSPGAETPPEQGPADPAAKLLRTCFTELLDLRRRALTPRPEDPATPPDQLATTALFIVQLMLKHVVDWPFVLLRHKTLTETRSNAGALAAESNEAFVRRYVAKTLDAGCVVPPDLGLTLSSALRALNQGEVQPLLEPVRSGRWRDPYSLAQLRYRALLHVHLRWGRGLKKAVAQEEVAQALGTSLKNLQKWERSWVPEIVGDIRNQLAITRRIGRLARQHPDGLPEEHAAERDLLAYLEGEGSLAKTAEAHRALMRESAS